MKYFLIGCIFFFLATVIIFIMYLMNREDKKKVEVNEKKEQEIEKQKTEDKASIRGGDSTTNFDNSIDILQKLSKK